MPSLFENFGALSWPRCLRLTKIIPGDPDVLILDVIEARDGTTARAWDTRVTADWRGYPVKPLRGTRGTSGWKPARDSC